MSKQKKQNIHTAPKKNVEVVSVNYCVGIDFSFQPIYISHIIEK